MNKLLRRFSLTLISGGAVIGLTTSVVFAQAKSTSEVLLYTSVPQVLATQFADAFMKKRPNIKVEIYRAGSTEVGAKLAAEREVGGIRADLLWLADAPIYYDLRQRGELLAYI